MPLSDITAIAFKWIITPLFWLIIIIGFILCLFVILKIRRWRALQYPVAEMVDLGKDKANINTDLKAGWLGKNLYFGGLWWTGEKIMRASSNDIVEYFSTEDFQEVNGKRGIVCYRDPIRQNVLIPINKINYINKELVAAIAPADYTDVAVEIVRKTAQEMKDWKSQLIQFGSWALVIIFSLVSIIFIVQMINQNQKAAADLLLQAGTKGAEACKDICSQAMNVVKSGGNAP